MNEETSSLEKQIADSIQSGIFLETIDQIYQDNYDEKEAVSQEIAALHNAGKINAIAEFIKLKSSDQQHDFFMIRHVLEHALPRINAPVAAMMDCVKHLVEEAGNDMAAGTLIPPFIEFCEAEAGRPDEVLSAALNEVDDTFDFITPAITAGSNLQLERYANKAVELCSHENILIRSRAVHALGRIKYHDREELIIKSLQAIQTTLEQAEYWLEHVRAFGSKAPVMLVGNKADLCAVNLDMARLKEKHDNVLGFYPLSCTQYQNNYALEFQRFQKDLSKEVAELGVHTVRFGKAHLAVLDELTDRSSTESFLKKTEWLDLCQGSGLAEQGDLNQAWLLDLFDKLGVIVHFPKLAALDSYILNPRWLTYGVYTLLYSPAAKEKQGRVDRDEIVRILSAAKVEDNLGNVLRYPAEKAAIIIQAMEQFKLCFPCRHEPDMIIIPALLDSDQPEHGFDKKDSLAFEFDFTGFLPRHIMPNFIVGRHDEIKGELVWQNGVVLSKQDNSAEALLQVDYHDRVLSLWVRGNKANDYFKIIYDDLKRILNLMPDLRFSELVIVPEASRIIEGITVGLQIVKADFQDLLALEENGGTEYICKAGKFDLSKILQIMPREARPAYQQEVFKQEINVHVEVPQSTPPEYKKTLPAQEKATPVLQAKKLEFYQQWWFYSVATGLISGMIAGIYSRNIYIGLAVFAIVAFLVFRLNRKRRFFSAAWTTLSCLIGVNVLPYIESKIDLTAYLGTHAEVFFKLDAGQTPALSISLAVVTVALFVLDYLENKD